MRKNNLEGQRFGKLVVIREDRKKNNRIAWLCQCDCGNQKTIPADCLVGGKSTSCGCKNVEIISRLNKKENEYDLSGEYGICYFNDNKGQFIFDKEDYEKIKDYCWYKSNHGYAIHDVHKKKSILAHRMIVNCPDDLEVDHINHNTLDNRKINLRICTHADNIKNQKLSKRNTTGYKGVHYHKTSKKWQTYININKKRIQLGYFDDINKAIAARKEAEEKYFGEFSNKEGTT